MIKETEREGEELKKAGLLSRSLRLTGMLLSLGLCYTNGGATTIESREDVLSIYQDLSLPEMGEERKGAEK